MVFVLLYLVLRYVKLPGASAPAFVMMLEGLRNRELSIENDLAEAERARVPRSAHTRTVGGLLRRARKRPERLYGFDRNRCTKPSGIRTGPPLTRNPGGINRWWVSVKRPLFYREPNHAGPLPMAALSRLESSRA